MYTHAYIYIYVYICILLNMYIGGVCTYVCSTQTCTSITLIHQQRAQLPARGPEKRECPRSLERKWSPTSLECPWHGNTGDVGAKQSPIMDGKCPFSQDTVCLMHVCVSTYIHNMHMCICILLLYIHMVDV